MSMKTKQKNNLINYGFIVALIAIIAFLIFSNLKTYRSVQLVEGEMQKYGQILVQAREKALVGEHFNDSEVVPYAYGVYLNNDEQSLVLCGDVNGDFDCVLSEFLQVESLSTAIIINEFHTLNFLKFQSVDGVCIDDECDLTGEYLVAEFQFEENSNIISQMFYYADANRFTIK